MPGPVLRVEEGALDWPTEVPKELTFVGAANSSHPIGQIISTRGVCAKEKQSKQVERPGEQIREGFSGKVGHRVEEGRDGGMRTLGGGAFQAERVWMLKPEVWGCRVKYRMPNDHEFQVECFIYLTVSI